MRIFILFISFIFSLSITEAQVKRTVVIEHFTNTYCSICASRNPGFFQNINQKPEVLHLSYHPSSPYAQCPLNQHNKTENDARTNFYGVYGGTPRLVVNGEVISAGANYTSSAIYDAYLDSFSSFSINSQLYLNQNELEIRFSIKKVASSPLDSGNLYVALYEDTLFMTNNNGEVNPVNVFRKDFLSDLNFPIDGFALPSMIGDSINFSLKASTNNAWNLERMFAAIIIQNGTDKSFIQADITKSSETLLNTDKLTNRSLRIFPNPVRNYSYLNLELESLPYQIVDAQGKTIQEGIIENKKILLTNLKSGIYFLRVENAFKKLLVE